MNTEEVWKTIVKPVDLTELGEDKIKFEEFAGFRKLWDEGDLRAITVVEKLFAQDNGNFKILEDMFFVDMFFKGCKSAHAFFAKRCLGLIETFVKNGCGNSLNQILIGLCDLLSNQALLDGSFLEGMVNMIVKFAETVQTQVNMIGIGMLDQLLRIAMKTESDKHMAIAFRGMINLCRNNEMGSLRFLKIDGFKFMASLIGGKEEMPKPKKLQFLDLLKAVALTDKLDREFEVFMPSILHWFSDKDNVVLLGCCSLLYTMYKYGIQRSFIEQNLPLTRFPPILRTNDAALISKSLELIEFLSRPMNESPLDDDLVGELLKLSNKKAFRSICIAIFNRMFGADSVLKFAYTDYLSENDFIDDGFFDVRGMRRPHKHALDFYRSEAVEDDIWSFLFVDTEKDANLDALVKRVEKLIDSASSPANAVKEITNLVAEQMQETDSISSIKYYQTMKIVQNNTHAIPIGSLQRGNSYHRALLFKVLVDLAQREKETPALTSSITRGPLNTGWNTVNINNAQYLVDIKTGSLLKPEEAARYSSTVF